MRKLRIMMILIIFLAPVTGLAQNHQMIFPLIGCLDHNVNAEDYSNEAVYDLARLMFTDPDQPELLIPPRYTTDSNGENMTLVLVKNDWRYTLMARNVDNAQHDWFGLVIYMRPDGSTDDESLIRLEDVGFDGHCDHGKVYSHLMPGLPDWIIYDYDERILRNAHNTRGLEYEDFFQIWMTAIVIHLRTIWYD
ncbi:hypothetical protein K8R42_05375 [bacterium]|nr:hypothetical protein [bacterium]